MKEKTSRPETKGVRESVAPETADASHAPAPPRGVHAALMQLQRTHGNRYVQRLLNSSAPRNGRAGTAPPVVESLSGVRGGGQSAGAGARVEPAAPAASDGGRVLQRAEDKGWMETASDYWGEVKEDAYKSMIATLRSTQASALAQLRGMTRELPPAMRVLAEQLISQVEAVSDILISFLLAVVGIVVGFTSGIAKALWGLLEFVHNIFYMIILFVSGFFSEERREEFDERANSLIENFKNVPAALRLLLHDWLERFKAAGPDRKTLMIGELTGEIEAVLATMLGGGAAAKSIPKVEFGLAPAQQFATAGARGGSLMSGTGTVAVNVAGPPTAGLLYGAHMMSVNERARVTSAEQKSGRAPEGKGTKEPRPEPEPKPEGRKPKQPEHEEAAPGTSRQRGGPYPAEWWKVIKDLEKRFPKLKEADLRPKRRGTGPGMAHETNVTTNEFSFRARLKDGTEIELDDILPDGTIIDAKSREYLKPRRPSNSIFDRRGLPFEEGLVDDADLLDLPPAERSLADQRRTLREVGRLGDESLLSGGAGGAWEDLTVLEDLDDFNVRKAHDQMSRQARFLEENGLKRIRWYTDNVRHKRLLEEIKGALKVDIYYTF
jgi:hypothetical protein